MPYKKETRGKVWRPKEQPGKKEPGPLLPDDLSEVLDNATDEEMMELAGKYCTNVVNLLITFNKYIIKYISHFY